MALGAQLQFKMGRFKNGEELVLNNVAKKAGTVYVTTDEKAMYVDVDDSTRIRIGDIIQLNSVREAQPPFSQDALYYFIEENALLKWTELFKKNENGTRGESLGMGWQQLNSVSDVTANLTALTNKVTEIEGVVNKLKGAASVKGSVAEAKAAADKAQSDATQALDDAKTADDKAVQAGKDAAAAQKTADDNATDITGLKNRLITAEGTITSNTTLAQKGVDDAATAKAAADAAQEDATQALTDAAAAQRDATQALTNAATNAENISSVSGRVTTLETKVSTLEDTTIPDLVEDVSDNSELIAGLRTDLGTNDKTDTNAFARIKALETSLGDGTGSTSVTARLDAVEEKANGNSNDITELSGTVEEQGKAIENLEGYVGTPGQGQANATVFELIATNTGDIAENAGNIATNTSDISTLKTNVQSHTESIQSINNTLNGLDKVYVNEDDYATDKAALEAKIDEGLAEINENINAANAMTYKGSVKTYADLPTSKVKVGDTYVIATDGGFTEGNEVYYAGDLLVATGTEYEAEDFTPDENGNLSVEDKALIGTIKGEVKWNHVTTGYVATHNPELKAVDSETENAIDIRLSSFSGKEINAGDLGKFKIVGGENVKVSITEGEIPVITIGMAWDTF